MTSVQEIESTDLGPAVEAELAEPVATISRRLWAGTALLAIVLATAGSWGWFGRWSQHLDATAVVVHGAGPVVVIAPRAGTIASVSVQVGDPVHAGAVIATLTSNAKVTAIRAGTSGTVLSLVPAGSSVDNAAAVARLDPVMQQAHAYLLVSDPAALARLEVGQSVALDGATGTLTGRISGVRTTPTTTAELSKRLQLPLSASSSAPLWLVDVALDPGSQPTPQTEARARVHLPAIPVYRVLLGDSA